MRGLETRVPTADRSIFRNADEWGDGRARLRRVNNRARRIMLFDLVRGSSRRAIIKLRFDSACARVYFFHRSSSTYSPERGISSEWVGKGAGVNDARYFAFFSRLLSRFLVSPSRPRFCVREEGGRRAWRRGRRTGDLFEILRSCRRCANSHMQTPKELAASIKINTGSVVGAKIKKDELVLCLVPTRRRTREFQSVICHVFLQLFILFHDDRRTVCEEIALENSGIQSG